MKDTVTRRTSQKFNSLVRSSDYNLHSPGTKGITIETKKQNTIFAKLNPHFVAIRRLAIPCYPHPICIYCPFNSLKILCFHGGTIAEQLEGVVEWRQINANKKKTLGIQWRSILLALLWMRVTLRGIVRIFPSPRLSYPRHSAFYELPLSLVVDRVQKQKPDSRISGEYAKFRNQCRWLKSWFKLTIVKICRDSSAIKFINL